MENAALVGLSRQMALRRELDTIANNLANLGTTGFKGETTLFEDYMMPVASAETFAPADRRLAFVHDWGQTRDLSAGALNRTENDLDLALSGDGFFAVQTPAGERYTRNGAFMLNSERELVTLEGHRVLGENGPIAFEENDVDIAIAGDGTVSTNLGDRGRVRMVEFADRQGMVAEGSGYFSSPAQAVPAEETRLVQGALEASNVQPIQQITRMIEVNRAYQSLANVMKRSDELRSEAINKLSQVQA